MTPSTLPTDRFYVGGQWTTPAGTDILTVVDPSTEQPLATVPAGSAADVDAAVAAARGAFEAWSSQPPTERARVLTAVADALEARTEEVALLISSEMGTPLSFSRAVQVGNPVRVLRSYATALADYAWEETIGNSLVVKEPIGVVAAITPWNYPLHQVVAKVAAALAAGCTVVLKPSEVAPLSAYALAQLFDEVGLPAGVFNLVTGLGPVVGEAMAAHPDVDMVSFTGSTAAGKRVSAVASETVKRVALELGGKSAFIVLDDADLPKAVKLGLAQCFINGGQTCTAWTRMLVPTERYDEVLGLLTEGAAKYPVGAPTADGTRVGPLANADQYDKVRRYIDEAVADGATVVTGGSEPPEGLGTGYYVRPTVLGGVVPGSKVEQEEVFGPVLAVIAYDGEDEAVRIANDSPYGLAGGVFGADQERAVRVARRMRTGMVDVNGGRFNALAPFGGYKQSGNGRELGVYGLEEFLEVKSLQL